MRMLQYLVYYARKNISQVMFRKEKFLYILFHFFKYEFIACHHGNESVEELRDILKRTGFIDSHIHFYTDSCEILKIHGKIFFYLFYIFILSNFI